MTPEPKKNDSAGRPARRTGRRCAIAAIAAAASWGTLQAKVDLVTVPARDATQLTIYNAADLTLVRETRTLTLQKGENRLEFGWAGTLIDPTSVQLRAPKHEDQVRLLEVSYPPNIQGSAVWTIDSQVEGTVPVEITFFTSGLTWRAFYMGTLSEDESALRLQGYVRVENRSGEDYENAQTRVIVGRIHTVDEIADLARRTAPYGVPGPGYVPMTSAPMDARRKIQEGMSKGQMLAEMPRGEADGFKQIVKEGLSEYFLYTIEGTETIANGWAKRLPSFDVRGIPVRNLYKYEEERWGNAVRRFVFFKNDKEHKLGETPLPDGQIRVYRNLADGHLAYTGAVSCKYIPVGEEAELDLGAAADVKIEPMLMREETENHVFHDNGNIAGFDRLLTYAVKVENGRALPIKVEIVRNMPHHFWEIENGRENPGVFDKTDVDSVKYMLELAPQEKTVLTYTVRLFEGERRSGR